MYSFTKTSLEELRKTLHSMPQEVLADAIVDYAGKDTNLWMHLLVIANLHAKDFDRAYKQVKERIDAVFGNDDIPESLEHEEQIPFISVQELIGQLLSNGSALEAARACEHAFTYAENIAGVMWPDSFTQDCYDPIVETWVCAQKAMAVAPVALAQKIHALEKYDEYCIFSGVKEILAQHCGPDTVEAYQHQPKVKA